MHHAADRIFQAAQEEPAALVHCVGDFVDRLAKNVHKGEKAAELEPEKAVWARQKETYESLAS